jgi:O-antigen/teichoic acid export membrane protein
MLVARQEFRTVALTGSVTDVLALVLAIGGLLTMGVIGLVWALLLSEIVGALVCLCYAWGLGLTQARWRLKGVGGMIREGLLLLGIALLDQTMMNVDQIFLLGFFPKEQYGTYALGLFIVATIIAISGIFLTAQPRILKLWGAGKKDESRRMVEVNLSLYVIVAALSVVPFILLTDLMVNHYLQHYAAGLSVYVLMPALALARGPLILLGPHYLSNNHERRLIAFRAVGLLLAVALNVLVVWQGWSIACIVLASTAGYLLTDALVFWDFERSGKSVGRAKYAMMLASLVGVVGLFLFYEYRGWQSTGARYVVETLGALLAYLALVGCVLIATSRSWKGNVRLFNEGASMPFISSLRGRLAGIARGGRS